MRNSKTAPLRVFVLAGGRSARMGRDKSRLLLGSRNFLERVIQAARALEAPVHVISEDDLPGLGPVGGVQTAFNHFAFARGLFLSCDTPLISPELLRAFLEASEGGAQFASDRGRPGFPFVLPRAAGVRALAGGQAASLRELSQRAGGRKWMPPRAQRWQLLNVNTPADYREAVRVWTEQRKSDAVLEVRHLTVQRGAVKMVSDFSWRVGPGQHWAVLGANGCGKTSLFSALLGYFTPTRGDIFVLGEEYGDTDWPKLRRKIGMVSSSVRQMMPEAEPAWITVASGKYAMIDFWGSPGRRDRAEALELLRGMECEAVAERPWACLSQGERQRVLIARALMAGPALLILDEPCAGLDPAARESFLDFLDRLGRRRNAPSMVLVTHHVEEVMPVFTHVLLMRAGAKLAEGPVKAMLTSKRLSAAFGTPMTVRKNAGRYSLKVTPRPLEMGSGPRLRPRDRS